MNKLIFLYSVGLLVILSMQIPSSQARGFHAVGSGALIGAGGRNFPGLNRGRWKSVTSRLAAKNSGHWKSVAGRLAAQNNGHWKAVVGGFGNQNRGLAGYGFKGTTPNGGTGEGSGIGGWKRGVGGFEGTQMGLKAPNGSSYNGYTRGKYNARTGLGTYDADRQFYNAKNNKDSGWTNDTTYNNGKGVTQIDTDNHGDYTVDWGKGQKPTMTYDN
jgi:hypothetical protein